MGFWQIFLLFSVMSSLFVLWPLFRSWREQKKALRQDMRAELVDAISEDRKKELEETHNLGDISDEEFKALNRDLEKTLAFEHSTSTNVSQYAITFGSKSRITLLGVCVLVPLLSLAVYSSLGAKKDWEIKQLTHEINHAEATTPEQRNALIAKIHKRLKQTPDNGHLLFLLGSMSTQAGNYDEAVEAYRRLMEVHPNEAMVIAELAQALFLRAGNTMTPEVRKHTQLALSLDGNLPTALGLAGIDAFQGGKYQQAIDLWQRAVKQLAPNSPASMVLIQGIARAQSAIKTSGGKPKAKAESANVKTSIAVSVDLGDDVKLDGGEVLFVYARAWQGPKMPLAIQRLSADKFPVKVTLDKSMAMAAGMDIASVSQLEVVARISRNGNAIPQSGDWLASFGPVILGKKASKVKLTISEQIP